MSIVDIDVILFHWINGNWTNPILDFILPVARNKYFWVPLYVFILSYLTINYKRLAPVFILFIILNVVSTDVISSQLIKKTVKRIRPCNQTENLDVRLLVDCGGGYSFTSSHATNHFGIAAFLFFAMGSILRKYKYFLFPWAAVIAYAQVYVGVHFPLDIFFGSLLGFFIGSIWAELYLLSIKKWSLV